MGSLRRSGRKNAPKKRATSVSEQLMRLDQVAQYGIDLVARGRLVSDDEHRPFGGTSAEEARSVVQAELGTDPALDGSESMIAVECLARAINARSLNSSSKADPKSLAVFLISDRPRATAEKVGATPEPIIDNGSCTLTGRVWITAPRVASGYEVFIAVQSPNAIFAKVETIGLGALPALVYDPRASDSEIRFYPSGLQEPDIVQTFRVAEATFNLATLDSVLQTFYERNLITPDAAGRLSPWRRPEKYVPCERTEAFFQASLKSALNVAFLRSSHQARWEIPGTEGRCDLMIVSRHTRDPNAWIYHAVMELKVLRSRNYSGKSVSTGVTKRAISSGAQQVVAYKGEHSCKDGMLCCFDMRMPAHCDGEKCLQSVNQFAKEHRIYVRRYRIYGSSKDLRADKYPLSS